MTYTHRNGETEPPTGDSFIGIGNYWFKGVVNSWDCGTYEFVGIVDCTLGHAYNDSTGEQLPKSDYIGQWWGPLRAPWEEER